MKFRPSTTARALSSLLALILILGASITPQNATPASGATPPAPQPRELPERAPGEYPGLFPYTPQEIPPDPFIQSLIDQVETNTLYTYTGDLSGEWAVDIGGSSYTIATRYTNTTTPIEKATQYAYEYFQDLGLPVEYHYYNLSGSQKRNIVAEQVGTVYPDQYYLVVGHLDSTSSSSCLQCPKTDAPGADDNASGSVGVMVAAEILSQYDFEYTLRYVLFTGEEQGLWGSAAYADDAHANGDDILGVLNLDMIAYNTAGSSPTFELHTRAGSSGASDLELATLFSDVVAAYDLNLIPLILQDGETASDHSSFWNEGYDAILGIEDWTDHTPYYHQTEDTLSTLNMDYFTEFARAAVGMMAHLAKPVSTVCTLSSPTFTYQPQSPEAGQTVSFSGSVSAGSTAPVTYTWDFGDGGSASGQAVHHVFTAAGSYTVKMTASNCAGSQTAEQQVSVTGTPDIYLGVTEISAELLPGGSAAQPLVITNPGTAALTWILAEDPAAAWLEAAPLNGSTPANDASDVTLTFTAPGIPGVYTTTLQITSNDPDEGLVELPVTLQVTEACTPVSGATIAYNPLEPQAGQTITFNGSVAGGTQPVTYTWDFGDSAGATGAEVTHIYTQVGDYPVTLTATNCGGSDEKVQVVQVTAETLRPDIDLSGVPVEITLRPGAGGTGAFEITNTGEALLTWGLAEYPDAGWLTTALSGGSIDPQSLASVALSFSAPLQTGVFTTTLQINSNDPDEALLEVPVNLSVTPFTLSMPLVGYKTR